MGSIVEDYLNGSEALRPFFRALPHSLFQEPPSVAPWGPSLVEAVGAYQQELGNSREFRGNEAVIVTGQQPGILTGPLYTVYKAITAIRLAAEVSTMHGVPCLPVFWVGSDDHDFEEARSTYVLAKTHEPIELRYEPEGDVRSLPMYRVPLESSLHDLVDTAADSTTGSEQREGIRAFLHESLDASTSLADWTARVLARLFRDTPLLIFSPHLPEARRAAVPVLEKTIADPLADTRLLNATGGRLEAMGYGAQVVKGDIDCNFFLEVEGRRRKVIYESGAFVVPEERLRYTAGELRTLLHVEPGRFSPNVALRCIVQQKLFGAAAYVAGPGEIAYWAQLKPLFEHYSLPMPVVYPRARCVVASIKLNKLLRKYGFAADELTGEPDTLLEKALARGARGEVVKKYREHRRSIEKALMDMQADLNEKEVFENFRQRIEAELDRFERTLLRADMATLEATQQQVRRLRNALAPQRKPQERMYSIFSFLFEQGWDLIGRFLNKIDVRSFVTHEVEL